jgi:ATP-dependent protease ClpP protease subunit
MGKRHWGSGKGPLDDIGLGGIKILDERGGGSHRSENHIYFYSDVDQESVSECVSHLREAAIEMRQMGIEYGIDPPPLHLHIQSDGGDVFAGMAALDAILEVRKHVPVHTHIEGSAASAATLMSVAGSHRTIGAHSFILIHQISSEFWGKYEEWKDEMRNNDLLMKTAVTFYEEYTRMQARNIRSVLKKDLWFDAKRALRLGLVDEIR